MTPDYRTRLTDLRGRLRDCATAAGRGPESVGLIAVSKTRSVDEIRILAQAGQRHFGENYVQEALPKMDTLRDLGLTWHFIGPLQSNKTAEVAASFDWVHSIDRLKVAERLSAQRPATHAPLEVCVQVNLSGESSKSGCTPAALPELCAAVAHLPGLRLRGLMTLPAPLQSGDDARAPFARLRQLLQSLQADGLPLDTLSAGMSDDYPAAIAEGATWVRIGTALFGPRPARPPPPGTPP